jgi:hypothetical protein
MGEPCELPPQQDAHERLIRNGAPLNVRPAAYLRLALGQEEGLFRPAFTSMVECYIRSQEGCSSAFEIEITELPRRDPHGRQAQAAEPSRVIG